MPEQHRGRVLIVEDEGIVATDIERCLEDAGFDVTAVATSMESALLEASRSVPDLVLMDIRIQGPDDGIEAARQLRHRFGLPIVYLTAHDDADTMARARGTVPMAFLVKPFKPVELTNTVEIALKRSWEERKGRAREELLLSAIDSVGDAVLTADACGQVRFLNRAAEALTGWTQASALGQNAGAVLRVLDSTGTALLNSPAWLDVNSNPLKGGSNMEFRIQSRDGTDRWVLIKATSIAGANDALIRVVVMQDITGRKLAESALRRQADLLDQSQEPILTWELNGAVNYWNRAAEGLYGFNATEAVGQSISELLKRTSSCNLPGIESALESQGRWSGELTCTTKYGQRIVVESLLVLVRDELGKKTVLETDRDVTQRQGAELEIQRLNRELSDRVSELTAMNQELEAFNYSVSHDLRAPLRHIDGYSKILLKQYGAEITPDGRQCIERICERARRMGRMVDELLELSRISRREVSKRLTGLKSVVEEVIEELKPDVQGREVDWRIAELPFTDCDPTLVHLVFANLLGNSLKFSQSRKLAIIEVGCAESPAGPVVFVRDNGVGFSMKYADKLFGVFQRLHRKEDFEGTGVGLVTVQRIIHKHGGRIWAEAELDQGATFYFTLGSAPPGPDLLQPAKLSMGEI